MNAWGANNVSWVEDADEFTLADTTGDIEVNLTDMRSDIDAGDYVTVTGTVDVISEDWETWYAGYYDTFDTYYELDGFDQAFYDEADWDDESAGERPLAIRVGNQSSRCTRFLKLPS